MGDINAAGYMKTLAKKKAKTTFKIVSNTGELLFTNADELVDVYKSLYKADRVGTIVVRKPKQAGNEDDKDDKDDDDEDDDDEEGEVEEEKDGGRGKSKGKSKDAASK